MYYADNTKWPSVISDDLNKYLDRSPFSSKFVEFKLVSRDTVSADLALEATLQDEASTGLKSRLEEMASESGLYQQNLKDPYKRGGTVGYTVIAAGGE